MEMNREKYEELMKKFALEIFKIGVTDKMISSIHDQCERAPNIRSAHAEETTDKFTYRYDGYMVEATRTIKLVVKKCNP